MHSLKSTGIAVLLLAVSVGLYQFSASENSSSNIDLATELGVSDGSSPAFGQQQPFGGQPFQQPPNYSNYPNNGQMSGHANGQMTGQVNGQLASSHGFPNQTLPPTQGSQNRYPFEQPTQNVAPAASTANKANTANTNDFASNLKTQLNQSAPTNTAPSFDQLRNKFNQTANNTINSVTNEANQQFNNFPAQATNQFNQLSQSANQNVNQAANQAVNATQNFGNEIADQFRSSANSLQQNASNTINDFQQSMPDLSAATSATRQSIDTNRDNGLINALQTELNSGGETVSVDTSSGGDFLAPPIQNSPEISIDSDFSKNDFNPDFKAQPIELTSDANNRQASEQTPIGGGDIDFNVQQANVVPDFSAGISSTGNIEQAWPAAEKLVEQKQFRQALRMLTQYYRKDDLTTSQRTKLNDWLDALAGKVIYSSEHNYVPNPYKMKVGETLSDIANRWKVPAQVVYNINRKQIGNEPNVIAGTELKMINGPFHAEIDMSSQTLTLFLNDLYAGRFPVKLGISGNPRPGDYNVVAKSVQGHTWRDADGNDFPPESPENGYGPYWIGMTGSLCIHAVTENEISGHSGCIGLSEKDAKDIFGILANRSKVKVVQ